MDKQPVRAVYLSMDVHLVCMAHAYSTDTEEVMGLLIGFFKEDICYVKSLMLLQRTDKRKDRVEIAPEQMCEAIPYAEETSHEEKTDDNEEDWKVVGWYHSHPNITIFPSHVDVRTQFQWQTMDSRFIGLIYGVYDKGERHLAKSSLCCFQTIHQNGNQTYDLLPVMPIPKMPGSLAPVMSIKHSCLNNLVKLNSIVYDEEKEASDKFSTDPLDVFAALHNEITYMRKLAKFIEVSSCPLKELLIGLHLDNN